MIGMKTFTVTSQPYYEEYSRCYKNILMVNWVPDGPLKHHIQRLKLPHLSPFQKESSCNPIPTCGLAIRSLRELGLGLNYGARPFSGGCYKSGCDLMTPDEIPNLIAFLQSNGYQIESQITQMLNQSEVKFSNQKLVFNVTYYGANPPNIVYMR